MSVCKHVRPGGRETDWFSPRLALLWSCGHVNINHTVLIYFKAHSFNLTGSKLCKTWAQFLEVLLSNENLLSTLHGAQVLDPGL